MGDEYMYISPKGLKHLTSVHDPKDPAKNNLWTTDYKMELPITMKKEGAGSETPQTLIQYFTDRVAKYANQPALSVKVNGVWVTQTYNEYLANVYRFAKSLVVLGATQLSAVNIIGFNHPAWLIAYYGSIFARYLPVGIYTTNNPEACFYVAEHSEAEVIVCDTKEQVKKFLQIWDRLPRLKAIVVYNDIISNDQIPEDRRKQVFRWNEFLDLSKKYDEKSKIIEQRIASTRPGHCCTLIYTSGTTGNPKGVMLSHDNYYYAIQQQVKLRKVDTNEPQRIVSYLPLSHVVAQLIDIVGTVEWGCQVYFAQPDALQGSLVQTLQEIRPTLFFSVPRVWEKIHEKMMQIAKSNGWAKTKIANWAKGIGKQGTFAQTHNQSPPTCFSLADKLVYHNVKKALGLDQSKYLVFGAAPLSPEIREYFLSLNMFLINGYGMSECTGAQTLSDPQFFDSFEGDFITSTGASIPGSQIKIHNPDKDGNGEICYRGRHVFMGYFKDEASTRATLDSDRYLHSGDVGKLDARGNLSITGRIKELIITAGGENVAPILIEDEMKKQLKIISNIMVIGEQKKYLAAIITLKHAVDKEGRIIDKLSDEVIQEFAAIGSKSQTFQEANSDPLVTKLIQSGIEKGNKKYSIFKSSTISKAQNIRKWILVPGDFTVDSGELTPTLKLKRREVLKKWHTQIESLYQDANL